MGIYIVLKRTTVKNNKRDKKRAGKSPIQKVNEEFYLLREAGMNRGWIEWIG